MDMCTSLTYIGGYLQDPFINDCLFFTSTHTVKVSCPIVYKGFFVFTRTTTISKTSVLHCLHLSLYDTCDCLLSVHGDSLYLFYFIPLHDLLLTLLPDPERNRPEQSLPHRSLHCKLNSGLNSSVYV